MAYGSCQDAESAPTPAGTMTVISWPWSFALFLGALRLMSAIRPAERSMVKLLSLQLGLYPLVW